MALQTPEIAMQEAEAEQMAKAYLDMQRHYASVVSGKTMDTMRFCMVVATVYGGRLVRINARKKVEAASKASAKPASATAAPAPQASAPNVPNVVAMVPPRASGKAPQDIVAPGKANGSGDWQAAYAMMGGEPIPGNTHE